MSAKVHRTALSSGQAARFCLVTSDTIVNWIKGGQLLARRTAGGQFRILVSDLRAFMDAHEMETDLLDAACGTTGRCWEGPDAGRSWPIEGQDCDSCLAFRVRAERCFELRCALATDSNELEACEGCRFLEGSGRLESRDRPRSSAFAPTKVEERT